MRFLRSRRFVIGAVVALLGISVAWLAASGPDAADPSVVATATRGEFVVTVTTSGELRARQFVQITVPAQAQQAGAFQMRIQSLVPEGTIVRQGDVVAELDRSTLASRQTDVSLNLQKAEAQLEQARLDTALTLATAREAIRNFESTLEQKRLEREQAVYEAPTVRRQADIEFERAQRQLAQARADLITRTEQAMARMREVGADVARHRNMLNVIQTVLDGFTIRAPAPGMVIYVKEWNGRKRTVGSQVSSWDNAVATLPDLTQMESITYVNEIDIRRIAVGQPVAISLDSDPTKRLTGRVVAVANVGEQRPNQDAKVFEVRITIAEADTTLRPGMTTGNAIETLRLDSALSVPLEAINTEGGVTFVYHRRGGGVVRQQVRTGEMNDHAVVILEGLEDNAVVLLAPPENASRLELIRLPGDTAAARPDSAAGDSAARRPARNATPARR